MLAIAVKAWASVVIRLSIFRSCRPLLLVALLCAFSAHSQELSQDFDDQAVAAYRNTGLTVGALQFQFYLDDTASDQGYLSVNNNGASNLGAGEDLYLIALGENAKTNNLRAVSSAGNFRLQSIALAKGVFGSGDVKVEGLLNGAVIGSTMVTLPDGAPEQNSGQLVELSGPQWAPLDGFRIITADNAADFDVELDDIVLTRYCNAGTLLNNGSCTAALPGFFVPNPEADIAIPCSLGRFQDLPGQTSCKAAPAGSFVGLTAATAATPCSVGRFQSEAGRDSCEAAPAGTFVDLTGAIAASLCPLGRFQDETGQTSCKVSQPGSIVDAQGAIAATACPLGRFQDEVGQSSCKVSPAGSFVDAEGAAAATACPAGTFQESSGATSCQSCPADTVPSVGRTSCITRSPPDTPTISAIDATNGELRIEFSSVMQSTEDVTYTLRCVNGAGQSVSAVVSQSPAVITGLVNNEEYQCAISATNDLGTSAASEPFTVVPEALPTGLGVILLKAILDARQIPD